MGRILIVLIFLFTFTSSANAEIVESWVCQENSNGDWSKIIAEVTINTGRENGDVLIFGEKYIATCEMSGINKSWKFGSSYQYAFVINSDGESRYYDYSKSSKSDDVKSQLNLFCKKTELVKEEAPAIKIKLPKNKSEHI